MEERHSDLLAMTDFLKGVVLSIFIKRWAHSLFLYIFSERFFVSSSSFEVGVLALVRDPWQREVKPLSSGVW